MDKKALEAMIRKVLLEELGQKDHGVRLALLPQIRTTEADRLDTGDPVHRVYTHNLFSLEESPRMGVGVMEMEKTTFPWTLGYDEVIYMIEGRLHILVEGDRVSAGPGELLFLPMGSSLQFSVPEKARFLYVTDPADWKGQ